jgi:nucleotide-binding universal stress UspA family protein
MLALHKILFPIDFSDCCHGAARAVQAVARRFGAEVTALYVRDPIPAEPPLVLQQALDKLVEDELSACLVLRSITPGDPAEKIVEQAREGAFDLIMMPAHGCGPFRRFLLGLVTAKVLHDAACPVWTSVSLENWPAIEQIVLRRVVCGVDFGPRSEKILACASRVAQEFGAKLTAAHVIVPPGPSLGPPAFSEWTRRFWHAAETKVQRLLTETGSVAEIEIEDGNPASALSEVAERLDADLLVIGRTHALNETKLGIHAHAIVAHAPCPVLSV